MSPIAPRRRTRRMLASLAISSAVFVSGASISACQNETTAQPPGPQLTTEAGGNSATPSTNQAPVPDPAPPASPATSMTTSPIPITSVRAAPLVAPPAPRVAPPAPPPVSPPPIAAALPAGSAQESGACDGDYYRNSDGNCVHRPQQAAAAPAGATAQCQDGSYSFSQHRQGTCSGHGGVARWL
ncbi:MAG TPA: DUF3761 domain-containing protein [Pseudonocardiaceae bacterium]|nr:DUF3761 domain-containing protein [Pseudonocardiaceae bacterium]